MGIRLDLLHRVTDEELRELSERNPGYQFERTADGRLLVTPTGLASGRRSLKVAYQLERWNERTRLGVVFDSSTGFRLPDGSLLSPDASWVRRERWEALSPQQREGFGPFCPDAVFEVRSASQSLEELREKNENLPGQRRSPRRADRPLPARGGDLPPRCPGGAIRRG